ncbi:helix-turn-helix transcriptional regulator [Atopobacter phocae]|uniref:helix-turn-helix transcriptional regulator n=1 Tax=Atopobacter phocae TaxID=136492 RepID=UPI00046EF7A4|nr:helix-turn-helix transcriptional regulator [Atopobacter phocae]
MVYQTTDVYSQTDLDNESYANQLAANVLLDLRNKKHLTQQELAKVSNKNQSYIAKIETGKQNISLKTLNQIVTSAGGTLDIHVKVRKRHRQSH